MRRGESMDNLQEELRHVQKQLNLIFNEQVERDNVNSGFTGKFYPNLNLKHRLDRPILGKKFGNEMDEYDQMHPAVLAKGSVVVTGAGRLILDGHRSDLVMKVNGQYLSLRTLLDLGTGLDYSEAPDGEASGPASEAQTLMNLCRGPDSCTWRRNWGLDACTPLDLAGDYTCACGGGWEYGTHLVRLRQYVCKAEATEPDSRKACFQNFAKGAPTCCAPQIELDDETSCTGNTEMGAWVDVPYDCKDASNSLCQESDRKEFHASYEACRPLMANASCLKLAHERNQQRVWRGTRDTIFDDGGKYSLLLEPSASRDCINQRLDVVVDDVVQVEGLPLAYTAAWTCSGGSELYFWSSQFDCNATSKLEGGKESITREECDQTYGVYFGSSYFAMTPLKSGAHNTEWHCLSFPDEKQQAILKPEQLIWRAYTEGSCVSLYLGERDVFEFESNSKLGVGIYPDNALVRHVSNLKMAVFPVGVEYP